ncbi:mitochondrial inner membrane protein OXA1L [Diabrotica virgifera virgifera]|uniref:Mitochondrial inner membrane protein OXA1L n=1 Tax=Diabrotica virgifera virgifera TaxID=50390 RepID=A0A6P7GNX6_DIAVI|nr:mitochondrial inner membrane protein OXA1L [Diabrotica virgifera virgifera]
MSRYCSIASCQKLTKSIKNSLNLKNDYKEVVQICLQSKNVKNTSSFWNKILKNIAKVKSNNSSEAVSVFSNNIADQRNDINRKTKNPKLLHKEIQKLCSNLQKHISQNKPLAWSTAGVAAVGSTNPTVTDIPTLDSNINTASSATEVKVEPIVEAIPEPPVVPDVVESTGEVLNQLNALGEPTFASLGLGGYSPVGIVQNCFEYLHVTMGMEWWAAIAIGTLVIRICLFPLVIMAQRNAAKMNNYLPQMQVLQLKMTEARQTGNQMDAARYSQELMMFMKEKGLNPFKNMIVPLAQMPIFISFFMGLRQMTNVPVDSLSTGGLFWFTDLTLPDQYFLLPIITSATLYATIELGTDTAKLSSQNMQLMKYVLRGLPLIVLPFTVNFPGAILCYWASSNLISLVQVGFLRVPAVREYFKIEQMRKFKAEEMPVKPKGFREGLKDSWENIKITKALEERKRLDELSFQRAGKGPIVKTYKYDPTKQVDPSKTAPVSAKSR